MALPVLLHKPAVADGKRSLMEAALRLAHRGQGLTSIGIRELAREAVLNPNTFYKHFETMEDLGLEVIAALGGYLRESMKTLRSEAASNGYGKFKVPTEGGDILVTLVRRANQVNRESVRRLFDYVEQNPYAFSFAARELHGSSKKIRTAVRSVLEGLSADLAKDFKTLSIVPILDSRPLEDLASLLTHQMLSFALDYIGLPQKRDAIRKKAETFVRTCALGTLVQNLAPEMLMPIIKVYRKA